MEKFYNISDADRELYNLYTRMNTNELLNLGETNPIYRIAVFERVNDKGNVKSFAEMSISGFMPILSSFTSVEDGLAFIESFKPGFRYTPYFAEFVNSKIKVIEKENKTVYKLGDYKYIKHPNAEVWYHKKQLHREDGPAIIEYYEDGKIKIEKYIINNNQHREDGPAIIEYYEDGKIKIEKYIINDKLYRENGPAIITYSKNGNIKEEEYLINNIFDRKDGPAYIEYYDNGVPSREHYYVNNDLTVKTYNMDGTIRTEGYYLKGQPHNTDGPAEIIYGPDGDIETVKFYINGIENNRLPFIDPRFSKWRMYV